MKRSFLLLFTLLTILLITTVTRANEIEELDIGDFSSKFVMEIMKTNVDLFDGTMVEGSSGTGFIYKIRIDPVTREKYAIVFTNLHVVFDIPFSKRTLTLSFSGPDNTKEEAKAEVIYESNLNDFAAIKFKFKDLSKKLQGRLIEGLFPDRSSPFYDFKANTEALKGIGAIALGNPLGGVNITTYGPITGLKEENDDGDMILTQAPINPGNSGGPLITEEGLIVGINTAKYQGADNMGFAIPIARVLEEFEAWEKDRSLAHTKNVMAISHPISAVTLDIHGAKKIIEKEAPGYFKRNKGAMIVQSALPSSKLQVGDQIFRVEGEEVGLNPYVLRKAVFYAKKSISVELVRNNKNVVKVKAPIVNTQFRDLRETIDLVSLSGMLFTEKSAVDSYHSFGDYKKRVWLVDKISSSQTNLVFKSFPENMSVLKAVRIKGRIIEINTLNDLKVALKNLPKGLDHIDLIIYQPLSKKVETDSGEQTLSLDNISGGIQHQPHTQIFPVPITEILMYPELDLKGFLEQFSAEKKMFKTRDFRSYTEQRKQKICEEKITLKKQSQRTRK